MTNIISPDTCRQAIAELHSRGAHFVLCDIDKSPDWSYRGGRWNKHPAPADIAAEYHRRAGRMLGMIPFSIDTTCVDVDGGDPAEFEEQYPALLQLPTRRVGGEHLYYADDKPRRNLKGERLGIKFDVRGAHGYVVLHTADAPARIVDALDHPPAGAVTFGRLARDLWELEGLAPLPLTRGMVVRQAGRQIVVPDVNLEQVKRGERNESLFYVVRRECNRNVRRYRKLDLPYAEFERFAAEHALGGNKRIPDHMDTAEVLRLARSAASFTWSYPHYFDPHDSAEQARAAVRSGEVRRASAAATDALILKMTAHGMGQRQTARAVGCSLGKVQYVLKRDGGKVAPRQLLLTN